MKDEHYLQALMLLRDDIQAAPMLDADAAELRDRWIAQLTDVIRLAMRDADQ